MNERLADLPLSEFDTNLEKQLEGLEGKIKHCFRSAFRHLRMAWKLHYVDSEMSAFRAITAEEEAGTALILALQERLYPGAEQLKPHDHSHKMSVFCVLEAANNFFAEIGLPKMTLSVSKTEGPKVVLHIDFGSKVDISGPLYVRPDNPLNFIVYPGDNPADATQVLNEQFRKAFTGKGFGRLDTYLKKEANQRNEILYASEGGIAHCEFPDSFILNKLQRVRWIGVVTIAVLQDEGHQLLATQCLEIFLEAMPKLTATGFDFAEKMASNPLSNGIEIDLLDH